MAAMFPITANIRLLCRLQSTFFVSGHRPLVHRLSFHGSCPTAASIILINGTAVVVGPWTEFFVAHLPPGTNIIGARCYPGHVPNVLGIPASELLNQSVPLRDVWGRAETARFARIAQEPTLSARMSAMETALIGRMTDVGESDEATCAAIRWLAGHPHGRVEELSRWLGFSSRQIQRRFTLAVGYGPKLFQSVLRFQRLLNLADRADARWNLAQLAANAGYADQAHMTREVQQFSGSPPSIALQSPRSTTRLSDLV
jgi:AraC-like DNA-binding protein